MTSPRCCFAGIDPASHQSIVILENLRASGVTWLTLLTPLSYDSIARRLVAMARCHAEMWDSPLFPPGSAWDWVGPRFSAWSMAYAERYLSRPVWDRCMASPRGGGFRVATRPGMDGGRARSTWRNRRTEQPCLIHGDTHLGKLYVTASGEPGFLDAQVSRTHWSIEVAYHIVGACDVADRPRWKEDLLRIYLDALAAYGAPAPPFADAFDAYARAVAYGLSILLINETRFQTEAIDTAHTARFGAAALALDTKARLS